MSLATGGACLAPKKLGAETVIHVVGYADLRGPELNNIDESFERASQKRRAATLQVDLAHVQFLTAAALGKLVSIHIKLRDLGKRLLLTNLSAQLFEIFEITRLDTLLDIRPSEL